MAARETVGTLSETLVRERKAAIVSQMQGEIIISRPVEKVCDFVADERDEPRSERCPGRAVSSAGRRSPRGGSARSKIASLYAPIRAAPVRRAIDVAHVAGVE